MIDGGSRGNDARWINHACEPNCEAYEEDGRVFIHALMDIEAGEELNYNYALVYEARHTPAAQARLPLPCGTPGCLGTMLAPKKRKSRAQGRRPRLRAGRGRSPRRVRLPCAPPWW